MKNWLPLVSFPEFAMERIPGPSCVKVKFSSGNLSPYIDFPPVPSPFVKSPPCILLKTLVKLIDDWAIIHTWILRWLCEKDFLCNRNRSHRWQGLGNFLQSLVPLPQKDLRRCDQDFFLLVRRPDKSSKGKWGDKMLSGFTHLMCHADVFVCWWWNFKWFCNCWESILEFHW